jgi:hypothetical protein
MTINVAFKIPDAVVFATDGLSSLIDVDPVTGVERIVSSVADVEKLAVLSERTAPVLAMYNGIGSLGNGAIATELAQFDGAQPRAANEPVVTYAKRLQARLDALEEQACALQGRPPRPFHLILAGFDAGDAPSANPKLYEVKWAMAASKPKVPSPVLHDEGPGGNVTHRYGAYYAGATMALSRIVEGYDAGLTEHAVAVLAGLGGDTAPPGALEELVHEARRAGGGGGGVKPLSNADVKQLVAKYTRRVVTEMFKPEPTMLSEHFSLQAAVNYCVFLAYCAYARENWSPARRGPPRVGTPLQVACLRRDQSALKLRGVRVGVNLTEFGGTAP